MESAKVKLLYYFYYFDTEIRMIAATDEMKWWQQCTDYSGDFSFAVRVVTTRNDKLKRK